MITTTHAQDLPLLEGLREGKAGSIERIYEQCYRQTRMMIQKNSGTEEDAKDIFQDALMALYRRLKEGNFELTCKLSSYLQIVSRNLWRARIRNRPVMTTTDQIGDEHVELDGSVIEEILGNDRRKLLYKHFDSLPDDCRQILGLFFKKTSMAEIASQMESTEAYMKKRKFICKSRLIEWIKADPLYKELLND